MNDEHVSDERLRRQEVHHSSFITHHSRRLILPALLALFTLLLHRAALAGWWLYDDPQLILEAKRQSLLGLLFNPAEYVHLAAHTFVPLQLVSYKIDLLFGGAPFVFYAHQLLVLTAAVVLLFFVLRQHVDERFAAVGAALFAGSWAATYAVRTLMIRHYVEGLVLALAALLLWRRRPWAASIFYLLAMLAKEVYAPLPLLFAAMWVERPDRRGRLSSTGPVIALLVYLGWRWRMTGLVGGYAAFPSRHDLLALPVALWTHLVGPAHNIWPGVVWAVAAGILVIACVVRERGRAVGLLALFLVVGVAPIVPLAAMFEWRYSFAFVACMIAALTFAAAAIGRTWSLVALLVLAVTAAVMSFPQRRDYREQTRVIEAEGRYVFSQPSTAPSLAATAPEWYLGGLAELRGAPTPRYFFSRFPIVAGEVDPSRAVTIDPNGRTLPLASTTGFGTPAEWQRERSLFRPEAPLSIVFSLAHHDASWQLGPAGGEFTFLTIPAWTAIAIPAEGSRRVPAARERQWFRIRRAAPDGSWTISPVLPVPRDGETTRWTRP